MWWNRFLNFLLFWGVWLLIPLLLDGLTAIAYLWAAFTVPVRDRRRSAPASLTAGHYPMVSIVVPVMNAERTLFRCIASVAGQEHPPGCGGQGYPLDRLELICVDNGSTDSSFQVFSRAQAAFPRLRMGWITLKDRGKWRALNAGIHQALGMYVFNLDADVALAPGAVREMVTAFEEDPTLAAATGDVRVDDGRAGRAGEPVEGQPGESGGVAPGRQRAGGGRWLSLLRACESLEYLSAFMVGRTYQARRNAVFTLAGAYSAFRREVLLRTFLYDSSTVSEDTKLTFDIRTQLKRGQRIGYVEGAIAYVEPVNSLGELFSQRVRWQRGQLEVTSLFPEHYARGFLGAFRRWLGRMLVSDHTLAFPRLTWTFLLPFLFLLGYPLPTVGAALLAFYVAYAVVDALFVAAVYRRLVPHDDLRRRIRHDLPALPLLPVYRQILYWFRLSGMLYTLAEPAGWRVESPLNQTRRALRHMFGRIRAVL